jgi:hypothetical protein
MVRGKGERTDLVIAESVEGSEEMRLRLLTNGHRESRIVSLNASSYFVRLGEPFFFLRDSAGPLLTDSTFVLLCKPPPIRRIV